jgi:hypothetical protein
MAINRPVARARMTVTFVQTKINTEGRRNRATGFRLTVI